MFYKYPYYTQTSMHEYIITLSLVRVIQIYLIKQMSFLPIAVGYSPQAKNYFSGKTMIKPDPDEKLQRFVLFPLPLQNKSN